MSSEFKAALQNFRRTFKDDAAFLYVVRTMAVEACQENGVLIWAQWSYSTEPCPNEGYVVCIRWAADGNDADYWYPSVQQAKDHIARIAAQNARKPHKDGWEVDLTVPGCHLSRAFVIKAEFYRPKNTNAE